MIILIIMSIILDCDASHFLFWLILGEVNFNDDSDDAGSHHS